jgi:hypothetical protein
LFIDDIFFGADCNVALRLELDKNCQHTNRGYQSSVFEAVNSITSSCVALRALNLGRRLSIKLVRQNFQWYKMPAARSTESARSKGSKAIVQGHFTSGGTTGPTDEDKEILQLEDVSGESHESSTIIFVQPQDIGGYPPGQSHGFLSRCRANLCTICDRVKASVFGRNYVPRC